MKLSSLEQVIALLTLNISDGTKSLEHKPFSIREWIDFVRWTNSQKIDFEKLIEKRYLEKEIVKLSQLKITEERVKTLMGRGAQLGLLLEQWSRYGIGLIFKKDKEYPQVLKKKLKNFAPSVFFVCGNQAILNTKAIAVVGSRKTSNERLDFARRLGGDIADAGYSILSGLAKGVDEEAILGSLEKGGTAIAFLADSLSKKSTSKKYRKFIKDGNLVLLSLVNPTAGFNVGNAMQRNKYIYCSSDKAVVVHSTLEKGGTWAGAVENLKANWTETFVFVNEEECAGNDELIKKGAVALQENYVEQFLNQDTNSTMFEKDSKQKMGKNEDFNLIFDDGYDEYELFIKNLCNKLQRSQLSRKMLIKKMGIPTKKFDQLIKIAIENKVVRKKQRPVLYEKFEVKMDS